MNDNYNYWITFITVFNILLCILILVMTLNY